jgi:class 3 adenylate cyclase
MPRSATTAYRKTGRPSPKKAKSTAPKKPIAARKAKRIAPKKTTQRSPKRVTPTSQKKTNQTSVAAMQAEISALRTELQEAHDQLTATAEVLQVINSSPGDLGPVFDAIIEKALALCGADEGALRTFDGEMFHLAALHGAEPAEVVRLQQLGPIRRGELLGQLTRGERVVHVLDVRETETYRKDPEARERLEVRGIRTFLAVALRKEHALLGALVIHRQEVRPFSDKQIALLQNFAAQAVIAMENARLITETREALQQQTATAEVLGVINSSPGDLTPVFDAILEKAMHLCGAAFGELRARDGDSFRSAATRGVPAAFAEYRRDNAFVAEPGSLGARILAGEQVVHVLDLKDEDVYRAGYRNRRALVDLGGARTALVASLRKDDTVLGFIIVYRQEVRSFTDKQIALLQSFADQAVIAMENARLLGELRQRTEEVAELNRGLEARVAEQVEELGRVGRLKRFLAPQLAELIVSQGDEKILESHRREIVVVFCDLRGYTAFTETAEPEEVLDFLRQYHGALGPLVAQYEGTLDQFSGDGIMVFFNDPVPIPDPAERAVKMAAAMREAAGNLIAAWRRRGRELGFGAGIAQGYATLGQIGFAERSGYTAIGTVCNLAARLCAEAKNGQILVAQPVAVAVGESVAVEEIGTLTLKGLTQPVVAYNVLEQRAAGGSAEIVSLPLRGRDG